MNKAGQYKEQNRSIEKLAYSNYWEQACYIKYIKVLRGMCACVRVLFSITVNDVNALEFFNCYLYMYHPLFIINYVCLDIENDTRSHQALIWFKTFYSLKPFRWWSKYYHFLAHLSWKLKWAFLITCRPSSLCPSVRPSVCLSVCKLFTLSSSSPEPLGQFQPNLAQSIDGWRGFKFVQMKGPALF